MEELSGRLTVGAVSIQCLAVERNAPIARDQRTEHDLLQVRTVILRISIGDQGWTARSVTQRAEVLALIGTEEAQAGGIKMQEFGAKTELLNGLECDPGHQAIKIRIVQVVERFGQAFLGEFRQIELTVLHDRGHIVGRETFGHAPKIMVAEEDAAHNHRHTITGRDFASAVIAYGMIDKVENPSPPQYV